MNTKGMFYYRPEALLGLLKRGISLPVEKTHVGIVLIASKRQIYVKRSCNTLNNFKEKHAHNV